MHSKNNHELGIKIIMFEGLDKFYVTQSICGCET